MKFQIELKSMLLGLGMGVVAMLGLGAAGYTGVAGRYQLEMNQNNVYVIDTETGQVWGRFIGGNTAITDGNFNGKKREF